MDHTVYGGPGVLLITGSDQTRYLNQSRVNPAGLKHIYNRIRTHPAGQKTIFMRGDIGKVRYTEIRCIYGHTRRIYSIWKSHIRFGPTLYMCVYVCKQNVHTVARQMIGLPALAKMVALQQRVHSANTDLWASVGWHHRQNKHTHTYTCRHLHDARM